MTPRQSLALLFTLPRAIPLPWTRLRNVSYLVVGNLTTIALGFITSAIVFRVLGATDAGRLTLVLSVVGLFSIIGEFGLRDAAVNYIARFLPTAPERAYAISRTFLAARSVLALLASAVGILGAGVIAARFYPDARVTDLIQLGAFSLFTTGLLAFSTVVLEARQNFALMTALSIFQSLLRAALILALFVVRGINLYTLLALESIVPLAVFIYSLRVLPRPFYIETRYLKDNGFLRDLGLLWHFTKWIAVAAFASAIFMKLDVLMLSYYRPPAEVGFYAVALALVGRLDFVQNAILTTAFPEACRCTTRAELRAFVFQSLRVTGLASVGLLPLFLIGGYVIVWLYGVEYRAAVPAFYPLLVGFLITLNAQPAAFILYPLNRPRWVAASDLMQLTFNVIVNLILIPPFGILGAAWGVLLTRVVAALITFALVRQFLWKGAPA